MEYIGPYRIINEIARGGMAIVFRALQPSTNRIVALKVMSGNEAVDAMQLRRFRQEAETSARLSHEHIVKVWEASVTTAPYYIALEYLGGGTLAARMQTGQIPPAEAVGIITRLCAALDHAHQQGVIHRDIKPTNILFDTDGRPVLTDFGIARANEHTRLTQHGQKFGTPEYMSPEQAKGLHVDHRSDLYSLGVVLYELLTGRPPYVNENPLVTLRQIIDEPLPAPRRLNGGIPPALEAVLLKALAKAPRDRFQSGGEFAYALTMAMTQGTFSEPAAGAWSPAASISRAWQTVKSLPTGRRFGLLAASVLLLAVVVVTSSTMLGVDWSSSNGTAPPPPVTEIGGDAPPPPKQETVQNDKSSATNVTLVKSPTPTNQSGNAGGNISNTGKKNSGGGGNSTPQGNTDKRRGGTNDRVNGHVTTNPMLPQTPPPQPESPPPLPSGDKGTVTHNTDTEAAKGLGDNTPQ